MILFFRRILFLLPFLFITGAYCGETETIDHIIRRGLENCYHFKWNSAEQDFKKVIKLRPDDPTGYHYLSGIYLWYYLSSENRSELEAFLKYSDTAVEKGEKIIDNDPSNETINYILGNAYSYRTLGYAKSESYINAIWASKKSEKFLKSVIENNPDNYDAYLGLGLYNFAAAQIPSAFKWALSLAGISGNEETGIRYIKLAAEKGNYSKVEAQYYLCQLLSGVTFDYTMAGEILTSLHRRYPANILFSYALAVVHLKEKDPDSAGKLLKGVAASRHTRFIQVISFSNFLLGDVYFRKNEYSAAIDYYQKFLATTKSIDYTGIAALRLGLSYDINDDAASAKKYYSMSRRGNQDIEDDAYALRKGEILKNRGMNKDEKLLLQYSNMTEAGKFMAAYKNLNDLIASTKNERIKAEAYYYLSESAFLMGQMKETNSYALKGAGINSGDDVWINAYCYYNAARASRKSGRSSEMMKYIELAEDFNKGDYRNQLKNMLKSLIRNQDI